MCVPEVNRSYFLNIPSCTDLSDPHGEAARDPLGSDMIVNKARSNRQHNDIVANRDQETGVAAVIHWQVPDVGKVKFRTDASFVPDM